MDFLSSIKAAKKREAKVKTGAITTLNVTQIGDGKLKILSVKTMSTNGPSYGRTIKEDVKHGS
ncbi:Uncharacterised protein [Mycobacteroides abscessus subsp. abscessus]|nr:Uncharacterised protein [Mycobacteroides abscessus subsp. abscessus]